MNPSRQFILRPVATSLLMAAIMLAGVVAYRQLPVSALPQVDYPTIQVLTFYPGASPDVMASSVTSPLEKQFGQVPGLNQMTSTSSEGSSIITLQFSLDLNIDVAEQGVQAAINASGSFLPKDLPNPPVYNKTNPADTPIITLALTSKTMPLAKVEDLADTRLAQKISQLPGVGLVSISGGQKPAVRVQANPTALAALGLNLDDLRTTISTANVNQAKGNFDGPRQAYTIGANDQLLSAEDYKPLVVKYANGTAVTRNGAPVKLSDVADVVGGAENVRLAAWMNESPAMIENISRYIEEGERPLQAALKGSAQIGFTILSLSISLIAVLIPLLFMGDIVGRLFREFAVTLSMTIVVSAVVSLTLTPMMCARLLRHKPESEQGRLFRASERAFKAIIDF